MALTESNILKEIQIQLSKDGARVFRNNVGLFTLIDGRRIRTGLCVGSSDLIGWYRGKFLAVEVKRKSEKAKPKQQNFIDQVNKDGGIAFVAHSSEEASKKLFEIYSERV